MLFAEFHNVCRILKSLDGFDVAQAGVLFGEGGVAGFHRDPFTWLMQANDDERGRVWRLVEARLPTDVLPTPEHAEMAAHFLVLMSVAREIGKDWWADYQLSQIVEHMEQARQIRALTDGANALLGLLQLVSARDDMPPAIKDVLQTNHRVQEARDALALVRKAEAA